SGAGNTNFIATMWQDHVVERGSGEQGAGSRNAEAERQRHLLTTAESLADHLPHVRSRRNLERADIAPTEVHAVVTEIRTTAECITGNEADTRTNGQLGLKVGVTDRNQVLVHIGRVLDDNLLRKSLGLFDHDGRK